ncbi:MAG TPA: hypothetical protein VIG76_11610 [Amnibacterium sp.]|jgi:hypothetical protein|uniref:hypothetical protein n=1 Tax=Amnibacterium sp. TaxID=1872496 RepID=UPI002F956D10
MTELDVDTLQIALTEDGDLDVTADGDDLFVQGRRFARVTSQGLVVDLPQARAADLVARGIAAPGPSDGTARGEWVVIADREDWHELASEGRDFVGEPPVGHDS